MRRNPFKEVSLSDSGVSEILSECRAQMEKGRFPSSEIESFLDRVTEILGFYREQDGEGKQVEYLIRRRFRGVELRLGIHGEKLNPLEAEREKADVGRSVQQMLSPLSLIQPVGVSYLYIRDLNVVIITGIRTQVESPHRSPMLYTAMMGAVCGLISLQLPEGVREALVSGIAKPVQSVCLGVLTGVMGPIVFLSLLTAIAALGSINDLTNLGTKIISRFIVVTLKVMAVSIAVSLLFYSVIGKGGTDLQLEQISELVLGIIPTNVISPLLEGNIPQLVVLSIGLGAALLLLDDKVDGLKNLLVQAHHWFMSLMGIVMTVNPIIPFTSLFITIAQGAGTSLLNGWEFIVAVYIAATICGLAKLVRVSVKYKVDAKTLLRKLKPLMSTSFASANNNAMLKQEYEISEKELGIKPEFSSFWIPMSQAMLNTYSTIMMTIPPFLILKYMGLPISYSFLLVLVLMVLELSIANPGTTGGWIILFAALGFSSDYVGMFLTYKMACANYNAASGALQVGLEQIEAADSFGALDLEKLREEPTGTGTV